MTKKGIFYGVSTGPGGASHLTLEAFSVLSSCRVLCFPESASKGKHIAYDTVKVAFSEADLESKQVLFFPVPMTNERAVVEKAYDEAASSLVPQLEAGNDVAFCSIGDVSLYSTAAHLARRVRKLGFSVRYIAGVTSFSAGACAAGLSLVPPDGAVHIIPSDVYYKKGLLPASVREPGTKVFMKCARHMRELLLEIEKAGLTEHACLVQQVSLPEQAVYAAGELLSLPESVYEKSYLSVVIVGGEL
ncbi:MAG: precorrin-2 C(20)-methyltransferase [Treponema sp.]|nr:precorrin-2 C(20)-methyltransferase [Treponema sp.]